MPNFDGLTGLYWEYVYYSCFPGSVAVICKFSKDKAFTEAKILITLSIGKLVRGLVRQKQLVFGHDLKWGNRLSDEPLLAATFVDIIYHTELKAGMLKLFLKFFFWQKITYLK